MDIERGDMVKFNRGGYSHVGIYIGDGRIIHRTAHFGSSSKGSAEIKEDFLWSVMKSTKGGSQLEKVNVRHSKFTRDEIVDRAKSRLGEKGYNLLFNNCEHFANWAAFGDEISSQVWMAVLKGVGTLAQWAFERVFEVRVPEFDMF